MKFTLTDEIRSHFKNDDKLYNLMLNYPMPEKEFNYDYFEELVRTIVLQQISIKAGMAVYNRLAAKYSIQPKDLFDADFDEMKSVGLTFRKTEYIKSLAENILNGTVHFNDMDQMTNEEIIEMLVKVKGIGIWTAEMFLIFSVGRLDVNSYGDLAIRRGFKVLYELDREPTKEEFMQKVKEWSPYSTIAHFYLWFAGEGVFL